jgi:hypothetical protein
LTTLNQTSSPTSVGVAKVDCYQHYIEHCTIGGTTIKGGAITFGFNDGVTYDTSSINSAFSGELHTEISFCLNAGIHIKGNTFDCFAHDCRIVDNNMAVQSTATINECQFHFDRCDMEGNTSGITGNFTASRFSRLYYESASGSLFQLTTGQQCNAITFDNCIIERWGGAYAFDFGSSSGVKGLTLFGNFCVAPSGGDSNTCAVRTISCTNVFSRGNNWNSNPGFVVSAGSYDPSVDILNETQTFQFCYATVTASLTGAAVPLDTIATVAPTSLTLPRRGYLLKVRAYMTHAVTAGTWALTLSSNGTSNTVVIGATGAQDAEAFSSSMLIADQFAAGSTISLALTTNGSFAAGVTPSLIVEATIGYGDPQ